MFRFFLLLLSFLLVFSFKNETNSLIYQRLVEIDNRIKYLDSILLNNGNRIKYLDSILLNNETVNVIDWERNLMIYNNGRENFQKYLEKEVIRSHNEFNENFKKTFWTGFDNCDDEIIIITDEDFLKFLNSIQEFMVKFFIGIVTFFILCSLGAIGIEILERYGYIDRKTEDELIQELFPPIPNISEYKPKKRKAKKNLLFETVKTDNSKSYLLEIECFLCRVNMKNAALHCGHCFCHECIQQLNHVCPICSQRFKDFKRIYL